MAITDAVIPVGGLGTRLLPLTRGQPKEMLPIVDKPAVQYVVEELARAGITRILFVTGRRKGAIEDHFDADPELGTEALCGSMGGIQILYTRQPRPAGLGDALRYADGFAGQDGIVVAHGDAVIDTPPALVSAIVPRLIAAYEQTQAAAVLAVKEVADDAVSRSGIVRVSRSAGEVHEVEAVVEKPDPGSVSSRTAIMGRYVLGPAAFAALRETPPGLAGEVQLPDALGRMIASGQRVVAVALGEGERRHDVGSLETYCGAFIEHALSHPSLGAGLRDRTAAFLSAWSGK